MDSVHQSHLVLDESAWLQQPSVYPGSRLPPVPSKLSRGMGRVEVYPPVVERGASVKVRSRIRYPSIFHPPKSEVSFRALAVVLDAGKMAERGLATQRVIEQRRVSLDFMCGSTKFEASESVKQEVEVTIEPLKWTEGADQIQRANLLVCVVIENSVTGKAAWTLTGYAPITVLKETPGEEAFFEYAARVDEMSLVWMRSLEGVQSVDVGTKAVDEVAGWRQETWEATYKRMRDSFTTSSRVQFWKLRTQQDVSDLAQLCSQVRRSASGFPVLGRSFKDSIYAELQSKSPPVPAVEDLRSFVSKRARSLWESLTATARRLDLNCLKASLHAGPPIRLNGPIRKMTKKIEVEDHDLKPMDEVTIGHGFDGLNRVVKLGSIITQFEVKEPGRGGERVQYQAVGPVCPAKNATDGKTFAFIEKVELELFREEVRETKMQTLMQRLLKEYKCEWRADPKRQRCLLLWLYRTNQQVYAEVNKALCTDDLQSLEEYAPFIWYFRELFNPLSEGLELEKDLNFVVSKGTRLRRRLRLTEGQLAMYKVRKKVCWPGFTSMVLEGTFEEETQHSGTVFHLEFTSELSKKNDNCYLPVSIGPGSVFGSHFGTEVLLPPHCMLRIHNVKDWGPGSAKTPSPYAASGVVSWIIELELDEAPCVWEFIEKDRWDDFQQYADDFPEKMDTRHCKASLINAVAKSIGMKATNLTGVDPIKVCNRHGVDPNEVDRETGNSPLITLALAFLSSFSPIPSPDEVPGVVQGIVSLVESGASPRLKRRGDGKCFADILPKYLHIAERHQLEYKQLQDAIKAQPFRASDLKHALKLAEAAELSEARMRLAQEERLDRVRDWLQAAMESRDRIDLKKGIADGKACGVPEDELLPARKILVEEEQKALECRERAEKQLKSSMLDRDVQMLKQAIDARKAAAASQALLAEAEGVLRKQLEREAARKRFKAAVASQDVSELRAFLQEANHRGWDEEDPGSVQSAQALLEKLEGLVTAMKAPIDEQALQEALKAAKASGVGEMKLAEGRRALEAEMKKTAAKDSLKSASNFHALQEAISQGEQAGLSQNELADAKRDLAALEEKSRAKLAALEEKSRAKEKLRHAMDSRDLQLLQAAIRSGQNAELSEKELSGAFGIQNQLQALERLQSACASESICELQEALEEARKASVPFRDIATAREYLKTLVRRILQDAIQKRDREELEVALNNADSAGLGYDDPTVCTATAVLQEELRKKKAVEGLQVALSANDPDALQLALEEARCASVSSSDMAEAEAAFEAFARQRLRIKKALEELLAACPAESLSPSQLPKAIERLKLALEEAIQAPLRQVYIDDAEEDLQALEAQLRAETGEARAWLQDATRSRGKQGLQAALDYASYSGIKDDDAHVQAARQVLKEVMVEEERREKALEVLRAACAAQCIEDLQLALEEARSASVRASHLADAEDQLNQLRLERANPQAARRNEAEKHLKKELKILAELLAQAAYKGVRDAVEPLCSSAFVDKAAAHPHHISEVFTQLMHAPTPEQAAELGRRLQAEMINAPESFEIFESDEHGKTAVERVAATVQNLQKACDQNCENPDNGLASIAEEFTKDKWIDQHLPSHAIDLARRWSIDAAIHARGGRTFAAKPAAAEGGGEQTQEGGRFFRATLTWQNIEGSTDLDMHMICPECQQEVFYGNQRCNCTGKSWHLQLDLDDRGHRRDSEENIWLEKISDNYNQVYELKVNLYSGRRVPFTVLFRREGHPDHMYNFQPHKNLHEKLTIFTWKPSGEPIISADRLLFDLSPLPSSLSHTDHSASALALPEMKTFAEDVDLSSAASLVRFLLDDRVDVKLVKGQYLVELQREGKTWLRRQEVPPHGFVTREEVERWTPAHGNCKIISVSHVWETREHPDPLGFQRDQVLEILDRFDGFQPDNCWFFIDFMSLFQFRRLEQSQEKCFRLSMQHMHVFYAHDHTWTLVVDELTPHKLLQEAEEKDITVWYDPEEVLKPIPLKELVHNRVPYLDRGWCIGETNWTSMRSSPTRLPDVTKDGYCRAPMSPEVFEERQENMKFTHRSDAPVVLEVHKKVFKLKSQATKLVLERLPEEEVDVLNYSLPHFHRLQSLLLTCCNINHGALERLISNLSPSLQQLHLRQCDPALDDLQGKFVVQRLASRFPTMKRLDLGRNKLGDATAQALGDLLSSGWPLKTLNVERNCVGDAGAQRLAGVIARHPAIQMNLEANELGETGKDAIRDALITALHRGAKPNFQPYFLLRDARAAVA